VKQQATVSVIIPVYNGGRYIPAALDTVLAQTLLPTEIIIVDDGSTDDSLIAIKDAIKARAESVPIHVLTQINQGQSTARNTAAEVAQGEFLAFLDQDDSWHPRHLADLTFAFADNPDLGWCYSDFNEIDGNGNVITQGFITIHKKVHPKRTIQQFLSDDAMILPSATVVRATAFHSIGGFDSRLCGYEDDDLFIRLFRRGWRSHFVRQSLTYFRVHPSSSSASSRFRESRMIFLDKFATEFPDDHRRHIRYVSDILLPRMLRSTLAEYATAIALGRADEATAIADAISTMTASTSIGSRRRLGIALLRRPALFTAAMRLHKVIPSPLRPAAPAVFTRL
jgi:glycosyltransferase involved in cell wall biosynthesis